MSRFLPLALLAVLVLVFVGVLLSGRDPHALTSPMIGKPLPAFELLPLVEGGPPLTDKTVTADGPAILNFFASWCLPCRVEQPVLLRLAQDRRIAVFGVAWKDDPAAARAFLKEAGNPFSGVGIDRSGGLALDLGVTGVPESFVIGRDGRVLYRHAGPLTDRDVAEIVLPLIEENGGGR